MQSRLLRDVTQLWVYMQSRLLRNTVVGYMQSRLLRDTAVGL